MKILNIHINEFESDFNLMELLNENFTPYFKLHHSLNSAKKELLRQENSDVRVFWWKMTPYNGVDYIQLYEVLID
jgi:hypothetical protein